MTTATARPDTTTFEGFKPEAIQFLADLAANNDRSWFTPRKADYERLLKRPLEAMCAALDERFRALGVPLLADPARSPFRIYRDTRFSKDKSPYKTNLGAGFPWIENREAPGGHGDPRGAGGYFHLEPGEIFVGGGMYHAETPRLTAFRQAIVADPKGTLAILEDPRFVARFGKVNAHESLKRVPPGYPPDHPQAELLKMKDVVFGRRLSDAEAMRADLPDLLAETLADGVPVMRFLSNLPA